MDAVSLIAALLLAQISGPTGSANPKGNSRYERPDRYGQPAASTANSTSRQGLPGASKTASPAAQAPLGNSGIRTFPESSRPASSAATSTPAAATVLPARPEDSADVAKALVASFRGQPAGPVRPLTLERAVQDARDTAVRRDVVAGYWSLWEADARARIWSEEVNWLNRLSDASRQPWSDLTAAHVAASV
jgi:hypothetical protein